MIGVAIAHSSESISAKRVLISGTWAAATHGHQAISFACDVIFEIRQQTVIATGKTIEPNALPTDLAILPGREGNHAFPYVDECRLRRYPIISCDLPLKLTPSVIQPSLSVPVDLDPTDQCSTVENLRSEGSSDRTLTDDGAQLLRDNPPILQEARLRVVAEMKNGLQFVSTVWITRRVPNSR